MCVNYHTFKILQIIDEPLLNPDKNTTIHIKFNNKIKQSTMGRSKYSKQYESDTSSNSSDNNLSKKFSRIKSKQSSSSKSSTSKRRSKPRSRSPRRTRSRSRTRERRRTRSPRSRHSKRKRDSSSDYEVYESKNVETKRNFRIKVSKNDQAEEHNKTGRNLEKFWNYLHLDEELRMKIARKLNPILQKTERQAVQIKALDNKNNRFRRKVKTLRTLLDDHLSDEC